MPHHTSFDGRHVVFFSWRDTRNPEGGGAEVYLEKVARGLVDRDARVTIFCAEHEDAPRDETRDGIRFVRRGSKMGVYLRGMLALAARRFGRVDVVVDVQNGLPFFTRLLTRKPVVVLVHHVHREQWPVVYPGITGRVGWWIESPARAPALPALPVRRGVPGDPRGARRPRRRPRPDRGRPQRHRPGAADGRRQERGPVRLRRRPAGPAQAGRARHRRLRPAPDAAARAAPDRRRLGLVGGRAAQPTPPASTGAARSCSPATSPRPRSRASTPRRGRWRCRR